MTIKPTQAFFVAIGNLTRWQVLREIMDTGPITVTELAERFGTTVDSMSKHVAVLRKAGIVTFGRGHLYRIVETYFPNPEKRELNFGFLVLGFPAKAH
jgi:DNA-binding MarR family transcriptional regulator